MNANRGNDAARDTVIVIDDSEIARAQMVEILRKAGMDVVDLPSPIGATRAIVAHKASVVVIDLYMPGMRGDGFAKLFRSNPAIGCLGVVLVSGEDEATLRRIADEVEVDEVVSKGRLKDLVGAVIRARTRARALAPKPPAR